MRSREMNCCTLIAVWLSCLFLISGAVCAQGWDADEGDPPEESSGMPPIPKLSIESLHLQVYEECSVDINGRPEPTGHLSVNIETVYSNIQFIPSMTDSTLTLRLTVRRRGEVEAPYMVPQHSFKLLIAMGSDTACCEVDYSPGSVRVDYTRRSPLLVLDPILDLPADLVPMQFYSVSTQRSVREFVTDAEKRFGSAVAITQLAPGFYPCLPIPTVTTSHIGGRRNALSINQSAFGYVVCFQVAEPARFKEVFDWVVERSMAELRLAEEELRKRDR